VPLVTLASGSESGSKSNMLMPQEGVCRTPLNPYWGRDGLGQSEISIWPGISGLYLHLLVRI